MEISIVTDSNGNKYMKIGKFKFYLKADNLIMEKAKKYFDEFEIKFIERGFILYIDKKYASIAKKFEEKIKKYVGYYEIVYVDKNK